MTEKEITVLSRFVARYRRKLLAVRIAGPGCIALLSLAFLVAVLQPAFAFFPWTALPFFFDAAVVGMLLFLVCTAFVTTAVRAPGPHSVAKEIERRAGTKNPLLSIALELAADGRNARNPFAIQVYRQAAAGLAQCPKSPEAPKRLVPMVLLTLAIALWCLVNPFCSPKLLDFWRLPFASFSPAEMTVEPGTLAVKRNAPVTLRLVQRTTRYPSCRLTITGEEGDRLSSTLLRPDSGGVFSYRCDSVKKTFFYRFSVNGAWQRVDTVTMVPPPRLSRLSVTLTPPAYTRKPVRTLPEGEGNFDAYAGSRAHITVASGRLSRAWLVREKDTVPLAVNGSTAAGDLQLYSPCNYTFALLDSMGQKSDSLPLFHIGCMEDEPPSVQIVRPGFNKDLRPEQLETLFVAGVDDIGIRSLSLKWKVRGQRSKPDTGERALPIAALQKEISTAFIWHLTALSLYPGDTALYWAEIIDTKPFGAPQKGVSDTFWFRIPGFEEIHRQLAKRQEYVEQKIGAVRDRQADMQEKLETLVKSANGRKELTWEQKQILSDVKKELASQSDSLKKSVESLKENIEKMKQQGAIGEELSKKMDQVRKAVDDLVKQYGDSLLFNLKDIEKPVSPQEMRQAIAKVEAMLPKLQEQLDNVLKFLDMLKKDRKLAELAMRAEQLAKEQTLVSQDPDVPPGETMDREKDLLDRTKELSKDIAENDRADSLGKNAPELQKSLEQLDSLRKSMQASMSAGRPPGQRPMKQTSGSLLSLSQDLMQMMNFNMAARMARERQRLLALSHDALALADWQEEIARNGDARNDDARNDDARNDDARNDDARSGDADDQRDQAGAARAQQALKDALKKSRAIAESLSVISPDDMLRINAGFKDAFQASEQVLGEMGEGGGQGAMSRSSSSLRVLGNSALSALSRMENGGEQPSSQCKGGQCMMPGLSKVSGRQAAINSMTSELLRKLFSRQGKPGGEGNGPGLEQARQEAERAQQGVADELKKLAEKYGNEAGDGLKAKVNGLEDEARHLAAMLERPAPDIAERQDRILAKMLETTLSMHKEGDGKDEWKSRTAEQTFGEGAEQAPGEFYKDVDTFHRLRQKAFLGNFPEGYRNALRAYFDELSEKYLK